MLSYRHQFHAGNFADVFKHALLCALLLHLGRKPKPFCYLDTHAGIGRYDLSHPWARKRGEYRDGIARVWERDDAPHALVPYLEAVRAENPDGRLRRYPGSPCIARRCLRAGDRMVLCELNERDCERLRKIFAQDRPVAVHHRDGYQALKALLPPAERRGLVLVDSAFDRAGEFARLVHALVSAHGRWPTGVLALWYPLMEPAAVLAFERKAAASGVRRILKLELSIRPAGWSASLRGCGMLVVNPPYRLDAQMEPVLEWLCRALAPAGEGASHIRWLVPE